MRSGLRGLCKECCKPLSVTWRSRESSYLPERREKSNKLCLNQQQPKEFQSIILCFSFFHGVSYLFRAPTASRLAEESMWDFNCLLWNRHRFNRWENGNHLALHLQPHLLVCLVNLVPQIPEHICSHRVVQPPASCGTAAAPCSAHTGLCGQKGLCSWNWSTEGQILEMC